LQRGPLGPRAINFLVRSRQAFAERGLLVGIEDKVVDAIVSWISTP
jgi:hypothetical protein